MSADGRKLPPPTPEDVVTAMLSGGAVWQVAGLTLFGSECAFAINAYPGVKLRRATPPNGHLSWVVLYDVDAFVRVLARDAAASPPITAQRLLDLVALVQVCHARVALAVMR